MQKVTGFCEKLKRIKNRSTEEKGFDFEACQRIGTSGRELHTILIVKRALPGGITPPCPGPGHVTSKSDRKKSHRF